MHEVECVTWHLTLSRKTVYQKIALYDCTNNVFTVKAQTLKLRKRSKKESKGPMVQLIPFYSIHLTSCRTIWGNLTGYVHTFPNLGLRDCALQFGYDFALWAVRFSISLSILRVVSNSSLFSSSIKFLVVRIIGFSGSICKFLIFCFYFRMACLLTYKPVY